MNAKTEVKESFDRIARLPPRRWNHNSAYHTFVLANLPEKPKMAIDVGCGVGELTALLARRAGYVMGIDFSPAMIEEATRRNPASNATYLCGDFDEFVSRSVEAIASIATFHHLDLETTLPRIDRMLADGGVLVAVDLYRRSGLVDRLLDVAAVPASAVLSLVRAGRLGRSREERALWRAHASLDRFLTFRELKSVYARLLPGSRLRRHLFWRYSVVYTKGAATGAH